MSTSTTRLSLTKPASAENVNVSLLDTNFDLIDAAVAATAASAASRPASAFSGRIWYETDTGKMKVNAASGSAIAADWREPNFYGPIIVPYNSSHTVSQRRDAIQAALDGAVAGDTVLLQAGKTWDVAKAASTVSATVISGTTSLSYCLKIGSGVTFIGQGIVRRDTSAGDAAIMINAHPTTGGGDADIRLLDTIFDGNNIDAATSATVWLYGLTGGEADRVEIRNSKRQGFFLAGSTDFIIGTVTASANTGSPFVFGQNAAGQGVTRCHLGTVQVRTTTVYTPNPTNFPGNPILCTCTDSTFDTWDAYSADAGIKVYSTDGLRGDKVIVSTQSGVGLNSGLKLQGTGTTDTVKNVQIGEVRSTRQNGNGLYMEYTENCQIGMYDGYQNCLAGSAQQDVWLGGLRDSLGMVQSRSASGQGVYFRNYTDKISIRRALVKDCTGFGIQMSASGGGQNYIGEVIAEDTRGASALMSRGIQVDGSSGTLNVGRWQISGYTGQSINISAGGVQFGDNKRSAQAGNYTIVAADPDYIGVTSTAAARTITLPTANLLTAGRTFVIKDESGAAGTNNITVQRGSTDTIDGATTKVISTNYGSVRVYTDGSSKWFSV